MSFRKLLRVAVGVAALVPFATCTDFTGPARPGVRVPIVPTFSKAALFAKAVYTAAGIEFDRVRVLITRNEVEVLKDTTVTFSPASADLTLPLVITANPGEVVSATLEYRNADIVMYSGTQSVTTVATGAAPNTPPTPLVLVPVGPGSSAATVQISPASGTFPTAAPVPFTATAFASDNTPIVNAIIGWEVDNSTIATVNAQGVVTPTTKGGAVKVKASTLNGKFAEASITFVTPPASIVLQSGGGQSAMAFEALAAPIVVKVLDANGVPVPGATVNFAVATGGGSLVVVNGISNASGLVSVNWTLGETVGSQSITATAAALPNNPITINATATERPAKSLAIGQQPLKSLMGAAMTPAITVKALDDKGHVVAGYTGAITMALEVNPNSATLGGTLTVNAVAGVATFSALTINKAGEGYKLKATATGLTAVVTDAFGIDQVPSGLSLNAGGGQSKTINSVLDQIAVKVADANGIGVAGVTVTFEVVSGGGSIIVNNGTTDAEGLARVTWTLGSMIGEQSIKATSGSLSGSPLTITATGTPLPAVTLAFDVQPSTAAVNASIAPAVKVKALDANGSVVTGFTGAIAVTLENANGATLGGTTSVAAVNGVATFSNLSVNLVGSGYKLNATSGALTAALSAAFTVTAGPPAALVFLVQPSNVIAGTAISPAVSVKIVDAGGNLVLVNSTVNIERENPLLDISLSGTTATAVNGVATFPALTVGTVYSNLKLKATSTGLTSALSNTFNVTPPAAPVATWTGAINSNWNDVGNWSPASIPEMDDSVVIAPAVNYPIIDSLAIARVVLVQTGATLEINSTYWLEADSIYNRGTLRLTNATVIRDLQTLTYTGIENRGTVVVNGDAIVGPLANVGAASLLQVLGNVSYGAWLEAKGITNEGTIEMSDQSEGYADIELNGDSLVNRSGASLLVNAGNGGWRSLSGALRNYGTITVSSPHGFEIYHPVGSTNVNTGTITFNAGGYFYQDFQDTTSVFTNSGTMSMGSTEWDVTAGNLQLTGGSMTGSNVFSPYGSQLNIDFSKFGMMVNLDDQTHFPGDSLNVPVGQTVKLAGGYPMQRVTVRGTLRSLDVGWGDPQLQAGAIIYGTGKIEAQNNLWIDNTFSIQASGRLWLNPVSRNIRVRINTSFTNNGIIEMNSSGAYNDTLTVNGTLTNGSTGTIGAYGGGGGGRIIKSVLNNQGTVYVEHDSYLTLLSGGTHLNSGTIDIADAAAGVGNNNVNSLALIAYESSPVLSNSNLIKIGANRTLNIGTLTSVTNTSTGVIAGKGTIDQSAASTSFTNSGTLKPGGAGVVGTMYYTGNYNGGTGKVEIDAASMLSGDVFQVSGTASLAGSTVKIVELAGFQVAGGNLWAIQAFSCVGTPAFEPVGMWSGYNDGCIHVYPIIIGGPPKPPI